jgi:transcriptional antiterminator NusG
MATNDSQEPSAGSKTTIFAVRTTIGQEKSVLTNMFNRLRVLNPFPDLKSFLIAEELRGYVFVEAIHQRDVMIAISGLRHVKGKIVGSISLASIDHVLSPRKVSEILEEDDIVEIVSGIFSGQKAQVIRMPRDTSTSQDVTLRLIDSDSAISIKIHGDFLKLVEKGEKHREEYIIKNMESTEGTTKPVPQSAPSDTDSGPAGKISTTHIPSAEAAGEEVFSFGETDDESVEEFAEVRKRGEKKDDDDEEEDEEDEWAKFGF